MRKGLSLVGGFVGNRSNSGGAIYAYRKGTIRNSVFNANTALRQFNKGGSGGAIMAAFKAALNIDGCVVYGNKSSEDAAGLWAAKVGTKRTTVTNSIFWGNRDRNGSVSESNVKGGVYSYLCVQNMLVARRGEDPIDPKKFPGSTAKNPLFVDADGADNIAGNEDDDFRLMPTSPLIDRGNPLATMGGLDHGGMLRRLDGKLDGKLVIDIGAHEYTNLRLASTTAASSLTAKLSGNPSLYSLLLIGISGRPLMLSPFGELQLDLTKSMLILPAGKVPATMILPLPTGPLSLELQGFGSNLKTGTFSNSTKVIH